MLWHYAMNKTNPTSIVYILHWLLLWDPFQQSTWPLPFLALLQVLHIPIVLLWPPSATPPYYYMWALPAYVHTPAMLPVNTLLTHAPLLFPIGVSTTTHYSCVTACIRRGASSAFCFLRHTRDRKAFLHSLNRVPWETQRGVDVLI